MTNKKPLEHVEGQGSRCVVNQNALYAQKYDFLGHFATIIVTIVKQL